MLLVQITGQLVERLGSEASGRTHFSGTLETGKKVTIAMIVNEMMAGVRCREMTSDVIGPWIWSPNIR